MTSTELAPQDARHQPLTDADKLAHDAATAAQVRRLANHPDVVALRVEKVRTQVDAVIWLGIFLGLAFTMVNVQQFAAAGAPVWSLGWLAGWLLDPMVSLVLVAVLRAEQITARYRVQTGAWAHRTKWFAFLATYVMNTWESWTRFDVAGVALHSVPPVLVFLAAETAPVLRDKLTEAVLAAADHTHAGMGAADVNQPAPAEPTTPAEPPAELTSHDEFGAAKPVRPRKPARRTGKAKPAGRKLLADYVADARAAWTPGTEITPAWVRSVTDCARGTSSNVAAALAAELADTDPEPTDLREAA